MSTMLRRLRAIQAARSQDEVLLRRALWALEAMPAPHAFVQPAEFMKARSVIDALRARLEVRDEARPEQPNSY